jgi:hypothetical protein
MAIVVTPVSVSLAVYVPTQCKDCIIKKKRMFFSLFLSSTELVIVKLETSVHCFLHGIVVAGHCYRYFRTFLP